MINQTEVAQAIQKELGSFFSTEAHTDSDIIRYINSALYYIAKYKDFPFLKTTYVLTYPTPLVAAIIPYNIKTLGINGDKRIRIIDKENWFFPEARAEAVMVEGDEFIASSAGTYEILYVKTPDLVSTTTTIINIPEIFKQELTDIAINFGYQDLKQYDKAGAKIGAANAGLSLVGARMSNPLPRSGKRMGSKHKI